MMHSRFIHAPADTLREHRLIFDVEGGGAPQREQVEQKTKTEALNARPQIQNPNTDLQGHADSRMEAMGKQFEGFLKELMTAYAAIDPQFKAEMDAKAQNDAKAQGDAKAANNLASERRLARRTTRNQVREKQESGPEVPATLDQKSRIAAVKIGMGIEQLENVEPARKQELVRRVLGNAVVTSNQDRSRLTVRYQGGQRPPEYTQAQMEDLRAELHFWREDDVEELDDQDTLEFVQQDLGLPVKNMTQVKAVFGKNTEFYTDVRGEVLLVNVDPAIYRTAGNQREYITQTQIEDGGGPMKRVIRQRLRAALKS